MKILTKNIKISVLSILAGIFILSCEDPGIAKITLDNVLNLKADLENASAEIESLTAFNQSIVSDFKSINAVWDTLSTTWGITDDGDKTIWLQRNEKSSDKEGAVRRIGAEKDKDSLFLIKDDLVALYGSPEAVKKRISNDAIALNIKLRLILDAHDPVELSKELSLKYSLIPGSIKIYDLELRGDGRNVLSSWTPSTELNADKIRIEIHDKNGNLIAEKLANNRDAKFVHKTLPDDENYVFTVYSISTKEEIVISAILLGSRAAGTSSSKGANASRETRDISIKNIEAISDESSIDFVWTKSSSPNANLIEVLLRDKRGNRVAKKLDTNNGERLSIGGLEPEQDYTVIVFALAKDKTRHIIGTGLVRTEKEHLNTMLGVDAAASEDANPAIKVTNIKVKGNGRVAKVTWTKAPNAEAAQLRVDVYDKNGNFVKKKKADNGAERLAIAGLDSDDNYEFAVTAIDKNGRSIPSGSVIASKAAGTSSHTGGNASRAEKRVGVKNIKMIGNGQSITLTWNKSKHPKANKLEIILRTKAARELKRKTVNNEAETVKFRALTDGREYSATLISINRDEARSLTGTVLGRSAKGSRSTGTSIADQVPGNASPAIKVTNIKVKGNGRVAKVTWTKASSSKAAQLRVNVYDKNGDFVKKKKADNGAERLAIAGLDSDDNYEFVVTAIDKNGRSIPSGSVIASKAAGTSSHTGGNASRAEKRVGVKNIKMIGNGQSITLTWNKSKHPKANKLEIILRTKTARELKRKTVNNEAETVKFRALTDGQEYSATLISINRNGARSLTGTVLGRSAKGSRSTGTSIAD